ncbi:hypothetical protein ACWD6P_19640 [Streptomyces sp. NPDC002446]
MTRMLTTTLLTAATLSVTAGTAAADSVGTIGGVYIGAGYCSMKQCSNWGSAQGGGSAPIRIQANPKFEALFANLTPEERKAKLLGMIKGMSFGFHP